MEYLYQRRAESIIGERENRSHGGNLWVMFGFDWNQAQAQLQKWESLLVSRPERKTDRYLEKI